MAKATSRHIERLGYEWSVVTEIDETARCVDAEVGDMRVELRERDERLEEYENYRGWVPFFFNKTRILYYFHP